MNITRKTVSRIRSEKLELYTTSQSLVEVEWIGVEDKIEKYSKKSMSAPTISRCYRPTLRKPERTDSAKNSQRQPVQVATKRKSQRLSRLRKQRDLSTFGEWRLLISRFFQVYLP